VSQHIPPQRDRSPVGDGAVVTAKVANAPTTILAAWRGGVAVRAAGALPVDELTRALDPDTAGPIPSIHRRGRDHHR